MENPRDSDSEASPACVREPRSRSRAATVRGLVRRERIPPNLCAPLSHCFGFESRWP